MKCVKDTKHSFITRISNEEAAKIVASDPKRYIYTTKSAWRSVARKQKPIEKD